MSTSGRRGSAARWGVVAALAYTAALLAVAFWPSPVDEGAAPVVDAVLSFAPLLTYGALEWSANVVLFVPLGVIGAMLLRGRPIALLVVPAVGLAASIGIEAAQGLLLSSRTASVADVVANALGATLGCVVAVTVTRRRASGAPHPAVDPARGAPGGGVEAVAPVDDDAARHQAGRVLG